MAAIAIPLVAFGALYLVSNQRKEEFRDTNQYKSPNQATDMFFQLPEPEGLFTDLAGRQVHTRDLVSNNMVPYFGKTKAIGPEIANQVDQTLDTLVGGGSLRQTKTEVAPLFNPEENVQWAYGAPSQTDFYQSRVNPSLKASNVKPFQEVMVGPGLNQGFTSEGSGGFNSGMEARQHWKDKDVDSLRVLTNPKTSFELGGHEGPAETLIKAMGAEGKVEKKLPDTFYINTPDRYLTTTGVTQGPTLRAIQPEPTIHRATTTKAYAGNGTSQTMGHVQRGMVRMDNRQQFTTPENFTPARGGEGNNLSFASETYRMPVNNRSAPAREGGLQSLVSAITSPIIDVLRPSRKELVVGAKHLGNPGLTVPAPPTTEYAPPPTLRDKTTFSPYALGARPQLAAATGYQVAGFLPTDNNRDTTSVAYAGIAEGAERPPAESITTIAADRVMASRIAGGNTNVFNASINQRNADRPQVGYTGGPLAISAPPMVNRDEGRTPQRYPYLDRNAPDLLSAFKSNPYTHSLNSVA